MQGEHDPITLTLGVPVVSEECQIRRFGLLHLLWTRRQRCSMRMSMRHNASIRLAFVLAIMLALPPLSVAASDRDLLNACWSVERLAMTSEERVVVKNPQSRISLPKNMTLAPFAPISEPWRGSIRRVELPPGKKLIALTFDFCEQPGEIAGYDGAIIDFLRMNRIKATFFAGGKWMATHRMRAEQLIADPLFEVASHGLNHYNTRLLQGANLKREIEGASQVYELLRAGLGTAQCIATNRAAYAAIPERLRLFRFPFGACNAEGLEAAGNAGMLAIQWDISTGDPSPAQSARAIADIMVRQTRPGSIIIAHANGRGHHTAEALPLAVPKLKSMGYDFVTVSELVAAGRPVVTPTCYDNHPGDTDKYDVLFGRRSASAEVRDAPLLKPTLPH
jgi:peptidoglycan-N-acetylglucosamine deacetylase